jgi:hypothetical protein
MSGRPWPDGGSKYNTIRPHSILGHYARLSTQPLQRDATLRAIVGFLPRPLHHRARLAQNGHQLYSSPDEKIGPGHGFY